MSPEIHLPAASLEPSERARLDLVPKRRSDDLGAGLAPRLDIVPNGLLQVPAPGRFRRRAIAAGAALLVNAAALGLFAVLLDWRDVPAVVENAIPIEIVATMPAPEKPSPPPLIPMLSAAPPPDPRPAPSSPQPTDAPPPPAAPQPALIAPPQDPAIAAVQREATVHTPHLAAESRPAEAPLPSPPPNETPRVLSAPGGAVSTPPTTPRRAEAKPENATASQAPKPAPEAQLQAALPMDMSGLPATFRAVLSGRGSGLGDSYRGLVFGRLGRAESAIARARAAHLSGLVIVAFTIDDAGAIVDVHVVQSSGSPVVDDAALDMIREAAPFPPPPPGVSRTYTPALQIGGS